MNLAMMILSFFAPIPSAVQILGACSGWVDYEERFFPRGVMPCKSFSIFCADSLVGVLPSRRFVGESIFHKLAFNEHL